VSDVTGFARWDGGVEVTLEGGRMGLLVNRTAAERTGLRLSSRLLGVGRLLED